MWARLKALFAPLLLLHGSVCFVECLRGGFPPKYSQALKFPQIVQRLFLQGPDAVAIQVEVLEGRQTIKGVSMDLPDLVLVQEDRMQMHFAGKHVGGDVPDVVEPQVSARKRRVGERE